MIGTTVILKSGSEPMTIVGSVGGSALCAWYGEGGRLYLNAFPAVCLVAIDGRVTPTWATLH